MLSPVSNTYKLLLCLLGKTLLAKAVANQTSATFLRVCGSELIQKYLVCSLEFIIIVAKLLITW